eukprot:m51a1_g6109 hypothetical protein (134) ;mRNA; r:91470-92042
MVEKDRALQLVQSIEAELRAFKERMGDPSAAADHVNLVMINSEALRFLATLRSAHKAPQQQQQQQQSGATRAEPLMRREMSGGGLQPQQQLTVVPPFALSAPTQREVVVPQFTPRGYRERARALLEDLAPSPR